MGFLEEKIGKPKSLWGLLHEILFFVMAKRDFEFSTEGLIILGFGSDESEDLLFDVLPTYEPIPELLKKYVPQMRADFVIFCNEYNPLLVEVKSSRPLSCLSQKGIKLLTRIDDWVFEMLSSPD